MKPEFYSIETFQKIMGLEESRGRLKEFCYSQEAKALSQDIKDLRGELRKLPKDEREELQQQLEDLTLEYEEKKPYKTKVGYYDITEITVLSKKDDIFMSHFE